MFRLRVALCLLALLVLAPAAAAGTGSYGKVLRVYERRGSIPPCRFSDAALSSALKGVDLYGEQYFADFTNAIQSAQSARAAGACLSSPAAGATAARSSGPLHGLKLPSVEVTAPTQADLPAPLLVLGGLAAAAMLVAAIASVFWLWGSEPALVPWWRHLWQEADHRASGLWSEFVDWLRPR